MNKYEKLIEYIVNDEQDKARALFHDIVVEKSRGIYESMMDDEQEQHHPGGDQVGGMMDEIGADEHGMHEEDDEMGMDGAEEFGTDDDMGGEMGDEMGGEGAIEDRVMDLETALDELKAEFEQLMSDEHGEEGHDDMGGMDDMGSEMDMGMDDEEPADESMMYEDKPKKGVNPFAKKDDEEEAEEEETTESRRYRSDAEKLREYVDKVNDGHGADKKGGAEGSVVGKEQSSKPSVNSKGIVAGKNDMGGTSANILKSASEPAPDGTSPKGKAGGFVKSASEHEIAKRNVNKVGGNKGAQNYYSNKETSWEKAKGKEGQTTDGSVSVDKNSLLKRIK
jgi:hypothetical protein